MLVPRESIVHICAHSYQDGWLTTCTCFLYSFLCKCNSLKEILTGRPLSAGAPLTDVDTVSIWGNIWTPTNHIKFTGLLFMHVFWRLKVKSKVERFDLILHEAKCVSCNCETDEYVNLNTTLGQSSFLFIFVTLMALLIVVRQEMGVRHSAKGYSEDLSKWGVNSDRLSYRVSNNFVSQLLIRQERVRVRPYGWLQPPHTGALLHQVRNHLQLEVIDLPLFFLLSKRVRFTSTESKTSDPFYH